MSTNLAKLKRGKGAPPPAEDAPDVIATNERPEDMKSCALQLRVPRHVFEAFSEQAGREFGFVSGSKKQLFLKMWEAYKAQNM